MSLGKSFEGYRLTLEHFYIDTGGNWHRVEKPLAVQSVYDRSYGNAQSYCINEMLERMYREIERGTLEKNKDTSICGAKMEANNASEKG